jgi:hypothetical protein
MRQQRLATEVILVSNLLPAKRLDLVAPRTPGADCMARQSGGVPLGGNA